MSGLVRTKLIDTMPQVCLALMVNILGGVYRSRRYSRRMRQNLLEWKALERSDSDALRAYQLQRLRRVLGSAARTPYYRRVFREVGFDPENVTDVDDLRHLPLLQKSDLMRHGSEMVVPGYEGRLLRRRSSGTTGEPVAYVQPYRMAFDETFAMLYEFYGWHGFKPLGRRASLAGRYLGRKASGVIVRNLFENQLLLGVHSLSERSISRYLDALREFQPGILQAHPSALLLMKQLAESAALQPPNLPLVTFTAESLSETERGSLSRWLDGATIFGTYGSGENVVAAAECSALTGYHVHPAVGICELQETDGEAEIIGTSLLNDAMPLLRYRTGDFALGISDSHCSCGCTWPRITGLQGRIDDVIFSADGTRIPSVVFRTGIAAMGALDSPYSIIQHREREDYTLVIYCDDNQKDLQGATAVRNYLATLLGRGSRIRVRLAPRGEMLTSRAKHRIVIKE